jgi:hypothetical protein
MKLTVFFPIAAVLALTACVPNQAYKVKTPTAEYTYPGGGDYFKQASASLAYIEFLQDGKLASDSERTAAYQMIDKSAALDTDQGAIVFVFVHGWKNNASEESGNVWGFRRALDFFASTTSRPVLGIYIGWPGVGWPGQNTGFVENVSFYNRETVASQVGAAGPLRETLVGILQHAKGNDYSGKSSVVLMGHSFGGLVLETAVTPILQERLDKLSKGERVTSPADLIVLINEAAPAQLARPLLLYLHDNKIKYQDQNGEDFPLVLSMTSSGDIDTKFAFPGGQWLSPHPKGLNKIKPPDAFGIDSDLTYYLLTTANTVALQNREFLRRPASSIGTVPPAAYMTATVSGKFIYDFVPISEPSPRNDTPYWVSQLPQVFVPDHGNVFGYEFMCLMNDFLFAPQMTGGKSPSPGACQNEIVHPPLAAKSQRGPEALVGQPRRQIMLEKAR